MGDSQCCKPHLSPIQSVRFSSDERNLISGSDDKTAKIWDIGQFRFKSSLIGHSHWVRTAVFSPDGLLAATGSDDKTVRLWDAHNSECINKFFDHNGYDFCAFFELKRCLLL